MPRGGARNRSGPSPDPGSGRSERRGLRFNALPSEGREGPPPKFPLPGVSKRERELWVWAWSTPQACAWELEPWRWHSVAMWVRTAVVCEGDEATAADKNSLHRFADQIGFTPAGLRENGWAIAAEEVAERRVSQVVDEPGDDVRLRLRVVGGG